jgi:large subunit ribosomal protein L14e
MFKIGQVCIKIAGRDAGNIAIIVDNIDDNYVLIDGNVRRKKCNVTHLEPLEDVLKIKKNASTTDVKKAMMTSKIKVIEKKAIKKTPKKKVEEKKKKETKKKTKKDGK